MAEKPEGGVAIFVLGLLGMLLCQVLGIIAWVQGNTYLIYRNLIGLCRLWIKPRDAQTDPRRESLSLQTAIS